MRVSARVDYGLRAAVELAAADGPVKGEALAAAQNVPLKFLENVLADLRRSGLVASQRGRGGGYRLARPGREITVADVVRAIEGPLAGVQGEPPEDVDFTGAAAPLRQVWLATRANLRAVLEAVTLADVVDDTLPPVIDSLLADPSAWERRDRSR